jgi:hypothetical protein
MRTTLIVAAALLAAFVLAQIGPASAGSCTDACDLAYTACARGCDPSKTDCFTRCINERNACVVKCAE